MDMELSNLLTYCLISFVAAATPGPGTTSVMVSASRSGLRGTLPIVAGVQIGMCIMGLIAVTGLTAVFTASAMTFALIQYTGAGYILWLGYLAIINAKKPIGSHHSVMDGNGLRKLIHGAVITFASPKTLLFYTSFFPLFVDFSSHESVFVQEVKLLIVLLFITFLTHIAYIVLISSVNRVIQAYSFFFNLFIGLSLVSMSLYMMLTMTTGS